MKKTAKRCKKEPPLQDLAERALTEYSQVMDALESKVTEGSEVTDEEDVCALFLNQMLNDSESMTEVQPLTIETIKKVFLYKALTDVLMHFMQIWTK